MKKLSVIAFLLVLVASCQKEDIRPNTATSAPVVLKSTEGDGSTISDTDPDAPTGDEGGGITDPLRKKDKKDNK